MICITHTQFAKLCSLHIVYFFMIDFFSQKLTFSKYSFGYTVRASNGLDPDQGRRFVGPDLGPSCLQRLSGDDYYKIVNFD